MNIFNNDYFASVNAWILALKEVNTLQKSWQKYNRTQGRATFSLPSWSGLKKPYILATFWFIITALHKNKTVKQDFVLLSFRKMFMNTMFLLYDIPVTHHKFTRYSLYHIKIIFFKELDYCFVYKTYIYTWKICDNNL